MLTIVLNRKSYNRSEIPLTIELDGKEKKYGHNERQLKIFGAFEIIIVQFAGDAVKSLFHYVL